MLRRLVYLLLVVPTIAASDPGDRLPAYLLQIPASVTTILVAETDASTLYRIENGPDGAAYVDGRYMSVGRNGVGKRRAWDRRTPLGIYFVTDQLDTSRMRDRYGPTAFPLDYPNIWDRMHQRTGTGIWIHGVADGAGRRPPHDTDGCIALPNDELLRLEPQLKPAVTPVIIARKVRWSAAGELHRDRDALASALSDWADSIRRGDLHRYLSFYAADFAYRGMSREEWAGFRAATMGRRRLDGFVLEDVLLLADPEDDRLFLSRFRQTIDAGEREVVAVKRLYWRRTDDGFEIVAEDNG
jgi:hypothetical protein